MKKSILILAGIGVVVAFTAITTIKGTKKRDEAFDSNVVCTALYDLRSSKNYQAHPERHNPFDIIYTDSSKGFKGVVGKSEGFLVFDSNENGERAGMMILIESYFKKGFNTIKKIVCRYSATDQEAYINFLVDNLKCSKDATLPSTETIYCEVGHLITVFEGQMGTKGVSTSELRDIIHQFNIQDIQTYNLQNLEIKSIYHH